MKLTADNYYSKEANQAYFTFSQVKHMMTCAASALADVEPAKSTALLVGGYVDAYFSGDLEAYKAANPEIFNSRTGGLKADFVQADKMIARIEADPLFMRMLTGNKQKIVTGTIASYPFAGKLDIYQTAATARKTAKLFPDMGELAFADGAIIDLKTVRSFEPVWSEAEREKVSFVQAQRYDLQLAIYQELTYQQTGKKLPCYIAAITKEAEPDIGLFSLNQSDLDAALESLVEQLPTLAAIKSGEEAPTGCGCCAWCRAHKKLTKATPAELIKWL